MSIVAQTKQHIKSQIETIFSAADGQTQQSLDNYMNYVSDDVILMPHNAKVVKGKTQYIAHVQAAWQAGSTEIEHRLIEFDVFDEIVIARGKALGSFQPAGSMDIYPFQTKNVFIFKRSSTDELTVWQVIFNMEPQ